MLKWTGLDTNFMTVNSMYAMHCVTWVFGDYFMFKLCKELSGKRFAVISLIIIYSCQDVIRQCSRVAGNVVEQSFVIATLYYYLTIKPKMFDSNLNKMTALISLCFLTRSSSLVPWVPLALIKIMTDFNFLVPILVSGITVTIPMSILSVLLDSYFYGKLCCPQWNFVVLNVVENIASFFGVDPIIYYFMGF